MNYIAKAIACFLLWIIHYAKALEFNATRINNTFLIDVFIGKPPQSSILSIDSMSPYTWVNQSSAMLSFTSSYKTGKSKSIQINDDIITVSMPLINNEAIYAKYATEKITIGEETIASIPLLLISDSLYQLSLSNGGLGLGRPVSDQQKAASFIHLLSKTSVISYKVFTIQFFPEGIMQLSFGEIDQEIAKDYQHLAIFPNKLTESPQFGVSMKEIFINSKEHSYHIDQKQISIDYLLRYSYIPMTLLIYLEKFLFNKLVQEDKCSLYLFDNQEYGFVCTEIDQLKDKTLIMEFDDWKLSLQSTELFDTESPEHKYTFGFKSNGKEDKFILGQSILQPFISVFDFELNQFGLYPSNNSSGINIDYLGNDIKNIPLPKIPLKERNKQQKMMIKLILTSAFICILLGTLFIGYRFIRRKKFKGTDSDYYNIEH